MYRLMPHIGFTGEVQSAAAADKAILVKRLAFAVIGAFCNGAFLAKESVYHLCLLPHYQHRHASVR
jgi:hypothetical protein